MLKQIKKLRGRSADELRTRAKQRILSVAERSLGFGPRPPQFGSSCRTVNVFGYQREAAVQFLEGRPPEERASIVRNSDSIVDNRFDLLGHDGLTFGDPVDWHFDPISGKRSPKVHWSRIDEISAEKTGDKKVIWELNRHQYFLQLGQAYWLTRDEAYAETFVRHIESWFDENPPKTGVNWLSSLELAFRSISWIWAYHFFHESPAFSNRTLKRMQEFLYLQARHIETYLSTYFAPNTHLTGEALGLYLVGSFMPELQEAKRWKDTGYQILMDTLDAHIRVDGSYCEQASHYARYTADFYAWLMILRQREGFTIEGKHREKLEKLLEYLMHLTQPNGSTPLFGDDDGGRLHPFDAKPIDDFRPSMCLGTVLFGREDFKFVAGSPTAERFWLCGDAGIGAFNMIEAKEPAERARAFTQGGFYVARDSWKRDSGYILIKCGPHGFMNSGHAHADALGFVLSVGGEPVFVDSGTYVYTADRAARDAYRSTAAHNCLTVDGESSSVPDGPFAWKTKANAHLLGWHVDESRAMFSGTHDGFERFDVNYQRDIDFQFNGPIAVRDRIESSQRRSFEVNFVLSPDIEAEIQDEGVELRHTRVRSCALRLETITVGGTEMAQGVWSIDDWLFSPIYGKQLPTKKLVYTLSGKGRIEILSRFIRFL